MKKAKNSQSKQTSKEDKLTATERKILRLLYKAQAPLGAYEVAKELKISFPTSKKYLELLVKKRLISEKNGN